MNDRMPSENPDTLRVSAVPARPPTRRQKLFAVLPTLLTLGNGACGFGAITIAAKLSPAATISPELWVAATLIYVAMIFDIFDGSAARLTNQTSEFGAILDSLCDTISFGVAPAFLMLQFMRHAESAELAGEAILTYQSRFLFVVAVLYVICTVLRLARFNVETEEDDSHAYFSGLPSPAAAGTLASIPIAVALLKDIARDRIFAGRELAEWLIPAAKVAMPLMAFLMACLMVSRVRYPHFFNQLFRGRKSRRHLIQLIVVVVLIALIPGAVLFLMFSYFAFGAPVVVGWQRFFRKKPPSATAAEEDSPPSEEDDARLEAGG